MQTIGPVEYIIVAFDGNQFKGDILPALTRLQDDGLIRIIDLAVVSKDKHGNVTTFEGNERGTPVSVALAQLDTELTGLLSEEDLMAMAEELPNDCTAAAMLFEHVWATEFSQAVRNANGRLVANFRIPSDLVEAEHKSFLEAA